MTRRAPLRAVDLGPRILVPYLVNVDGETDGSRLPASLLLGLTDRFGEDAEQLAEIFEPILLEIVRVARQEGLLGRFLRAVDAFVGLACMPALRTLVLTGAAWKSAGCASNVVHEAGTLAGLLSIGVDPLDLRALTELLPSRDPLYVVQLDSANYTMRTALGLLHDRLHAMLYALVKGGAEPRELVLDWFAWLATINGDRLKMHLDPSRVTPDRLITNAYCVLLKFAGPFLSPDSPKVALIDPHYYFFSSRLPSIADVTKNCAGSSQEYADFCRDLARNRQQPDATTTTTTISPPYAPNFVTECFHLTVQFFRLGPVRMINEYMDLLRDLREVSQALELFEGSPEHAAASPLNAAAIKNAKARMQAMKDAKLALDVYLLSPALMESTFTLVLLMVNWLSRLLEGEETGTVQLFKMLPEFLIEAVGEYVLFISRFKPEFWLTSPLCTRGGLDGLLAFMLQLLDRADLVKNPYIRAKFVDFLFSLTDPALEHLLDAAPATALHLAPKLMRFYVEVEATGASSQFYDKFNIRYSISRILKTVWKHSRHRDQIKACSRDDRLFVRFTNLLLNDVTFLLDESISKLGEIHERQLLMDDTTAWAARPAPERRELENGLRTLERQCESYIQLASATLDMLEYLTTEIVDPFLRPELLDRLAAMLSLNVVQMVGPKCSNLKVRQPEKYHWRPREVLSMLVGSILNMSRREAFLRAMARDQRSFSEPVFAKAAGILRRHAIRPPGDIDRLERLIRRVVELAGQEAAAEEALGEVPDEFLDPLMFTIMEDPVLLETSRQVVDRATIVSHLLNDPTDPFNRKPLGMEQVKEMPELRARIQAFLAQQRPNKPG